MYRVESVQLVRTTLAVMLVFVTTDSKRTTGFYQIKREKSFSVSILMNVLRKMSVLKTPNVKIVKAVIAAIASMVTKDPTVPTSMTVTVLLVVIRMLNV